METLGRRYRYIVFDNEDATNMQLLREFGNIHILYGKNNVVASISHDNTTHHINLGEIVVSDREENKLIKMSKEEFDKFSNLIRRNK